MAAKIIIEAKIKQIQRQESEDNGRKSLWVQLEDGFQLNVNEGDEDAGFSKLVKFGRPGVICTFECGSLKPSKREWNRTSQTGELIKTVFDQFSIVDPILMSLKKGKESLAEVEDGLEEVTEVKWVEKKQYTRKDSQVEEYKPEDGKETELEKF